MILTFLFWLYEIWCIVCLIALISMAQRHAKYDRNVAWAMVFIIIGIALALTRWVG